MPEADRRRGDSPQRMGENKLFVGGVSHKFRDHDLKQGKTDLSNAFIGLCTLVKT